MTGLPMKAAISPALPATPTAEHTVLMKIRMTGSTMGMKDSSAEGSLSRLGNISSMFCAPEMALGSYSPRTQFLPSSAGSW